MSGKPPLEGTFLVVDLTEGIAGAYCTKILVDAGAEVIKVEAPSGDPLRRRSASGRSVDQERGGPLWGYLAGGKRSVVVDCDDPADLDFLVDLISRADAVVWSSWSSLCRLPALAPSTLRERSERLLVLAISPYGLDSPWAQLPANEFTLEAMSGGAWARGWPDRPPVMTGGDLASFMVGAVACLALLIARHSLTRRGTGELIDCSALDVTQLCYSFYAVTYADMAGRPWREARRNNIPSVHRTKDGYVGIWVTTGQQWLDFCVMVERPDWLEDRSLGSFDNRALRGDELGEYIDSWTNERTTQEIVDFAALLRLPCAPVSNGATLPELEHFVARNCYVRNPLTGAVQPDVWYSLSGSADRCPPRSAPRLGEATEHYRAEGVRPQTPVPGNSDQTAGLPASDLRIADFTAFMAGPIIAQCFAWFGADVIHVESPSRPDGMRASAIASMTEQKWWETSPFFNAVNTNKRGVAVDLTTEAGRQAIKRVIAKCDVVIDNFSPRVMPQLGLDFESLSTGHPKLIMLRAPGYGVTGPWRDRVTYAPTVDEAGGAAWVTGFPDAEPLVTNSATDALGGVHAAIALMLAVEHRRRTGEGVLVESPQVGAVLSMTGEQVAEFSLTGTILQRIGNRSWVRAPQGIYRVADVDRGPDLPSDDWVAISVELDEQWAALAALVGADLAADSSLHVLRGRQSAHDHIDAVLAAWTSARTSEDALFELRRAGVPSAAVVLPHLIADIEPVVSRGSYEQVRHAFAPDGRIPGFPARFASVPGPWQRSAAPGLGEHNRDVFEKVAGLTAEEVSELEETGVIGQSTQIHTGW